MERNYALFDVVEVRNSLPEQGLIKGMVGTIIHCYTTPNFTYEVEFCDDDGCTIMCIAMTREELQSVSLTD
ncbi:DUF4926 domain-containing protein [Pectobacterium parmentieri]|uniref:DUF4926 domain-containing protein n=1 Tax=Pectobacterium parmentieri TaxID=1905730 RepID=UPI000EB374AE|nr:DUF4926 domain-containing protein [Pectobacterium parmentieri]QHQ17265.1 DUF4926 domain-containing protein [Pectobacterium parmentieri]RKO82045.1 DUF4926 domain-containing protein [Pectobacterium parmentieri]